MPSKEEIEEAVNHFIEHHDVESAIVIVKALLSGDIIVGGSRKNVTRNSISIILTDYERLEAENKKLNYQIEGKECIIETQVHNEEVLNKMVNNYKEKNKKLEAEKAEAVKKTEEKIEELEDTLDLCKADGKIAKYKMENLKEQISDLKEILEIMKGK